MGSSKKTLIGSQVGPKKDKKTVVGFTVPLKDDKAPPPDTRRQFVGGTHSKSRTWLWVLVSVVIAVAATGGILWFTSPLWMHDFMALIEGSDQSAITLSVEVLDLDGSPLTDASVGTPAARRWFPVDDNGVASVLILGPDEDIVAYCPGYQPGVTTVSESMIESGSLLSLSLDYGVEEPDEVTGDDTPAEEPTSEPEPQPPVTDETRPVKTPPSGSGTSREDVERFHDKMIKAYNTRDLDAFMSCFSKKALGDEWGKMKKKHKAEFNVLGDVKMINEKRILGVKGKSARVDWMYHLAGTTSAGAKITADITRKKRSDFMRYEENRWQIMLVEEK